jgi:hypothetical protein
VSYGPFEPGYEKTKWVLCSRSSSLSWGFLSFCNLSSVAESETESLPEFRGNDGAHGISSQSVESSGDLQLPDCLAASPSPLWAKGADRRGNGMSYEEALRMASRDERFMATVYAMNSLLIYKGVYTHQEFQQVFTEWVEKEQKKNAGTEEVTSRASQTSHA